MRVLMAQISPVVGDIQGNEALCLAALERGAELGAELVVLPELALSGYPPWDFLEYGGFVAACREAAMRLAAATRQHRPILVVGLPWRDEQGLRNSAMVAAGGAMVAIRHKSLLPTYDVFDESRFFVPETNPQPVEVRGLRLAVTICEDIWNTPLPDVQVPYTWDPVEHLRDCDLLLNLSASPFHTVSPHHPSKARIRHDLCRHRARSLGVPVVQVNLVGGNDELVFDGHSFALHPDGRLLAQGPRFAPGLTLADLDAPGEVPFASLGFEEEAVECLCLGLKDYAARCGFHSAVLGLSGGIDSALVCALAARALGPDNVLAIGMPGPYSSAASLDDARDLAHNLGVEFISLPIRQVYDSYRLLLGERFAGRGFDVTEENLQARVRGNLVMALSNKEGHLVLTTGNKSESAVGYCTLYGDMAGGIAVISDVFKTDVYRISRWLNRDRELIPRHILERPPSAELAPDQRDEDSLLPYARLDAILRLYLGERLEATDIMAQGHDPQEVRRVIRLVVRSEYKRWQAAPGIRISNKAFGIGRRMPLAHRWPG